MSIYNSYINGTVYYFHDYDYFLQQQSIWFHMFQVNKQLKKLTYGAMYFEMFRMKLVWICIIHTHNIRWWTLRYNIQFGINRLYSSTIGAAVTTFNWCYTITQQIEMIWWIFISTWTPRININTNNYNLVTQCMNKYQQHCLTTPFPSTITFGNNTLAKSNQTNSKSFNTYNHHNYESLAQGNIPSFIDRF